MTILLRAIHRDWCSKYGEQNVGDFNELNPLVVKILDECAYRQNATNQRYEEFIKCAQEFAHKSGIAAEIETLKAKVSPAQFYDHMCAFALGMQYAAKKVGKPIKADDFAIQHTIKNQTGTEYTGFRAAAHVKNDHYKIVLHPAIIMQAIAEPDRCGGEYEHDRLTSKERLMLSGAQEMLHFYQAQQGMVPQYIPGEADRSKYHNDPCEKEARVLQDVMIKDLALGKPRDGRSWC